MNIHTTFSKIDLYASVLAPQPGQLPPGVAILSRKVLYAIAADEAIAMGSVQYLAYFFSTDKLKMK